MDALDISLANLTMLNAVIPNYTHDTEEHINADDPANQERIDRILGVI